MKKIKLLLAAMAAMVSLGVNAQDWTASSKGAGMYLLYNVGSGQYFTKGNGWGTQASITSDGLETSAMQVELVLVGNDVQIRTSGNNNFYGVEHLSGGTVYTDQSRNKVSTWIFKEVATDNGPVYNIISADNHGGGAGAYLTAEGGESTIVGPGTDGTSDLAKWKLKAVTDFEATRAAIIATMDAATKDSPIDVTGLIGDANFDSSALPIYWAMASNNKNLCGGLESNHNAESYRQLFTLSQTLFVPNGKYELTAQAAQGGELHAVIYANEKESLFNAMTGGESSMNAMSESFTNGLYAVEPITVLVTDGKLTIGAKGTRNDTWCIWDNFQLKYFGVDLTAFEDALKEKVEAASKLEGAIPAAAYAALATVVNDNNKEYATQDAYVAAITAIEDATKAATALVAPYARYNAVKKAVLAIDETIDIADADALADAATAAEDIEKAIPVIRGALSAYLIEEEIEDDQIDLTDALIDNAAPYASTQYWTVTNGDGNPANANAVDEGNKCAEFWNQKGFTLKQTLASTLPAGYYNLTAVALTREGMVGTLFAGENTAAIATVAKATVNNRAQANTWFNEGNGVTIMTFELPEATEGLTIGLTADNTTSDYWTVWRSFELTYLGTTPLGILSDQVQDVIEDAYTAAEEWELPEGVAAYLAAFAEEIEYAKDDYTEVQQFLDAKDALEAALEDAKVAVKNYAAYNALYENAAELVLVDNDNEIANTELAEVIMSVDDKVEAATEAAEITELTAELKEAMTAYIWVANPVGEEAAFDLSFLLTNADLTGLPTWQKADGWYTEQTDGNSQVMTNNNATSEDGTKTAFFEYWRNPAAANDLFALYMKVLLPAGTYNMSCFAFAQDDGTHENRPNGVYFYANDTQGSAVNNARLSEASIEFYNDQEQDVKIGLKTVAGNTNYWMGIGYVELYKVAPKSITIDEATDFEPTSMAANVTLKRTFKADVWNTFVVPFQITNEELTAAFGADVKVAEFSEVPNAEVAGNSTINFNVMETPAITPNKPVLIKTAVEAIEALFANRTIAAGEAKVAGTNVDFVGTYDAATEIAAGDYFISANKLFKSTGATTIQGTRAYVAAKADGEVKLFIDGIETAISDVNGLAIENGAIFNLAGQRVSKAQKGIFILNGKKVVR